MSREGDQTGKKRNSSSFKESERQLLIQKTLMNIEDDGDDDLIRVLKNGQLEEFQDWESVVHLPECDEVLEEEEEEEEAQKEDTVLEPHKFDTWRDVIDATFPPPVLQKNIGITVPTFDHTMTQDDVHTVRNILSDHLLALFSDATIARCFFKCDYFNLFENKCIAYEDDEIASGYHITFKLQPFEMPINKKK